MKKKHNVWMVVLVMTVAILVLCVLYSVWNVATARVSGEIDCSSDHIEYVVYNESSVDCVIPVIDGGMFTVCALPKDLHCRMALQNFPIIRAFVEAME
jgi:hypothetical protein